MSNVFENHVPVSVYLWPVLGSLSSEGQVMTLIIKTVKVRINYIHRFDFGPINIGNKVWRSEKFSTPFLSVLIWPNNDKIISCQNTLNLFYNRQWLYQDTLMVNTVHLVIVHVKSNFEFLTRPRTDKFLSASLRLSLVGNLTVTVRDDYTPNGTR